MPITRLGKGALATLALGKTTVTAYCSTGAVMIVGCSTETHSATACYLTDPATLGLSTMDSGYPTISAFTATSTNVDLTFKATFTACQANTDWREWGIYNATASGTDGYLLNRYVPDDSIGTKSCAQSWAMTATISITT